MVNKWKGWKPLTRIVVGIATTLITMSLLGAMGWVANGAAKGVEAHKTAEENKSTIKEIEKTVNENNALIRVLIERTTKK